MELLIGIILGAVAGWLASKIMKSNSGGFLLNTILGIVGSYIGVSLFQFFGYNTAQNWLGTIIVATIGAIALLASTRLIFRKKKISNKE